MIDKCPNCKIRYREFRTDMTFAEVQAELWVDSDNPEDWKHKRRNTVLGRWHQIKQMMWQYHIENCRANEIHINDCVGFEEY